MSFFRDLLRKLNESDDYHYSTNTTSSSPSSKPIVYDILPTDQRRIKYEKKKILERIQNGERVTASYSDFKDIIIKLNGYEDNQIEAKISRYKDSYGFEGSDGCYIVYLKMPDGSKEKVFYEKFGYNATEDDSVYRPGKWEQYLVKKGNEALNQQYENLAKSIGKNKHDEQIKEQERAERYKKNHSPIDDSKLFN